MERETRQRVIAEMARLCGEFRRLFGKKIPGPWLSEPDRLEWQYKGYNCLISRNPMMFHLCGYAAVKRNHPLFGQTDVSSLSVPGGITHEGGCSGHICHVQTDKEDDDDVWWFGFDHAHWDDFVPGIAWQNKSLMDNQRYATIGQVKREVEALVQQLITIERGAKNGNV